MQSSVPLVGVTGGIGSGKSTVCRHFAALGRRVISADEIARELTEHDPATRAAIAGAFGAEIYDAGGALRRKDLAAVVFAHPAKLRALDRIVHPRVFEGIDRAVAALPPAAQHPYVIVEAALVFEAHMDEFLAATVVVRAAEENRIARVAGRDGASREDVLARMRAQMSPEEKAGLADFVIDNDSPEEGLGPKVAFVDRMLAAFLSVGRAT
jgi:dephospho-CoA kinase